MKILMVNKFHFIKGGSERYYFELTKILREHGHRVIPFSMTHPENEPTPYGSFFVDQIEFNLTSPWQKARNGFAITARILYSMHARKRIEQLIRRVRPDVAHLHMIDHQMSPSILHSLKKHHIPVIMTTHQSKVICPNYRLFNWSTKRLCEKCLDHKYYHPLIERCHKNSRWASLLISLEAYLHHAMKIYEHNVDIFHVPSQFFRRKFIEAGLDPARIEQLYYTIQVDQYKPVYHHDDYFVYFGRMEEAKGLDTLLTAMQRIPSSRLLMIGRGEYQEALEQQVRRLSLKNVSFMGARFGEELKQLISRSRFVIIPSECYDNSPLVVYEAYALGKPVIGADIGGIPELIDHQATGLLFDPGDAEGLADRITRLLENPHRTREMGRAARMKAECLFSPEVHYNQMLEKYRRLSGRGE